MIGLHKIPMKWAIAWRLPLRDEAELEARRHEARQRVRLQRRVLAIVLGVISAGLFIWQAIAPWYPTVVLAVAFIAFAGAYTLTVQLRGDVR
jgi:CHASE2 domain-containing sensor protein